jgi:hypothetical protein
MHGLPRSTHPHPHAPSKQVETLRTLPVGAPVGPVTLTAPNTCMVNHARACTHKHAGAVPGVHGRAPPGLRRLHA